MGITLANFNLHETKPVGRDLFIMRVIGTAMILIKCFIILPDMPSSPKLDLTRVVSIIIDGITGSKAGSRAIYSVHYLRFWRDAV